MSGLKDLTAIIISFLRPKYTIDCIKSLQKTYPEIQILVGENGETNNGIKGLLPQNYYIKLPFDSGISVARNKLLSLTKTKYILVGDNDFLYNKDSKLDEMIQFLEVNPDYDLIGGRVKEGGITRDYQGTFDIYNNYIKYNLIKEQDVTEKDEISGLRYKQADIVFNFFVARVNEIKDLSWDENIKVSYEHSHFFLRAKKTGKVIAFTPDAIVKHKFQQYSIDKDYIKYRTRKSDKKYFFESLGIERTIDFNGNVNLKPNE